MAIRVVEPPLPFVSLEEAKQHCRAEGDDEDAVIGALIQAAIAHIDGPAGWLGRTLGVQTLESTLPGFGCERQLRLPPPVVEVESVSYVDQAGVTQTFDVAGYEVSDGAIWLRSGYWWPSHRCSREAVRIRWIGGYGRLDGDTLVNDVPEPIRIAVLMHVAHLFHNRAVAVIGDQAAVVPHGYDALLAPYRIFL